MTTHLGYHVDAGTYDQITKYFLDIAQQIDEIKEKALRNDAEGTYDSLTIINLALYGLMNEKFELAKISANFKN